MNLRLGAWPLVAWTRLHWAQALQSRQASQNRAAAREIAAQAAAEARRLDMPGPYKQAEQLLGGTATAAAASPLTGREREVTALVAAALSNRQIADRLFLSERTVESHVRNVLTKLALTGRTQIATWAIHAGLRVPSHDDAGSWSSPN